MAVIDLRQGRLLKCLKGFAGSIRSIQCHPSLPLVASCGLDRFLRVHSLEDKKLQHKVYLKSRLNCVLMTRRENWEEEDVICSATSQDDVKEEDDEIWMAMETVGDKSRMKQAEPAARTKKDGLGSILKRGKVHRIKKGKKLKKDL